MSGHMLIKKKEEIITRRVNQIWMTCSNITGFIVTWHDMTEPRTEIIIMSYVRKQLRTANGDNNTLLLTVLAHWRGRRHVDSISFPKHCLLLWKSHYFFNLSRIWRAAGGRMALWEVKASWYLLHNWVWFSFRSHFEMKGKHRSKYASRLRNILVCLSKQQTHFVYNQLQTRLLSLSCVILPFLWHFKPSL